jgi:hypothetical protein
MPIIQQGAAIPTTVTGTWFFPNGQPVANGTAVFKLNQDALVPGAFQVSPVYLEYPLDAHGGMNGMIIGNDQLLPQFTTYTVTVKENGGGQVWGPEIYFLSGVSINMDILPPLPINAAFTTPFPIPGYATGAAVTAANFIISGWGTGAFLSNVTGVQERCSVMVTAGTSGFSDDPTIVFTYPGAYLNAAFNLAEMIGGTGMTSDVLSSSTQVAATFVYQGLPQLGQTYIFIFDTVGT